MAKLKITRADGTLSEHQITPKIEWAFELYAKKGFHKAFRDDENYTFVSAWEFKGKDKEPKLHKEDLDYKEVTPTQRSYK